MMGILTGKLKFQDLITNYATGKISHRKLWANVAYLAATIAFLHDVYDGGADALVWLVYLGAVGTSTLASKFLSLKYGKNDS